MTLMGFREYARHRGVSLATVQRKVERGIVPTFTINNKVKIPQEKADKMWGVFKNLSSSQVVSTSQNNKYILQYSKAKADVMELRAQIAMLDLEQSKERLLDAQVVKECVTNILGKLKKKLNQLVIQIGPTLLNAKTENELQIILRNELEQVLFDLSK